MAQPGVSAKVVVFSCGHSKTPAGACSDLQVPEKCRKAGTGCILERWGLAQYQGCLIWVGMTGECVVVPPCLTPGTSPAVW